MEDRSPIVVISGCPGTGKSTTARLLASRDPDGLHLATDDFYRYPAHPIAPVHPQSATQNRAVVRAFSQAAVSFWNDGYRVFVDGVIGPWWLSDIESILAGRPLDFVLCHASLACVLSRAATRGQRTQASATPEVVRQMHRQFDTLDKFETHQVITEDREPAAVADEVGQGLERGRFRIPPTP